jgi:hypothetical protein
MKTAKYWIALSVLIAQGMLLRAQPVSSNGVRWLVPSNSIAAARSTLKAIAPFRIAPNTPEFEQYGLNFMLSQANATREKWKLDIPSPLTVDDVFFFLVATPYGIEGHVRTRDERLIWGFDENKLVDFRDHKYLPDKILYYDDDGARLAKIKSKITAKEAGAIARDALHRLGLTEKQLHVKESPEVNQYKFEESDGKVYPLPKFNVTWHFQGPKRYAAENMEFTPIKMEISGITRTVAEYVNHIAPREPLATNYFQMLGLPTNYLETLPARDRRRLGLPTLTNSVAPQSLPTDKK